MASTSDNNNTGSWTSAKDSEEDNTIRAPPKNIASTALPNDGTAASLLTDNDEIMQASPLQDNVKVEVGDVENDHASDVMTKNDDEQSTQQTAAPVAKKTKEPKSGRAKKWKDRLAKKRAASTKPQFDEHAKEVEVQVNDPVVTAEETIPLAAEILEASKSSSETLESAVADDSTDDAPCFAKIRKQMDDTVSPTIEHFQPAVLLGVAEHVQADTMVEELPAEKQAQENAEVAKCDVKVDRDPKPVLTEENTERTSKNSQEEVQEKKVVANQVQVYREVVQDCIQNDNQENVAQPKEEDQETQKEVERLEESKVVDRIETGKETSKPQPKEPYAVEQDNRNNVKEKDLEGEQVNDSLQQEVATDSDVVRADAEVMCRANQVHLEEVKEGTTKPSPDESYPVEQKNKRNNVTRKDLEREQVNELLQYEIATDTYNDELVTGDSEEIWKTPNQSLLEEDVDKSVVTAQKESQEMDVATQVQEYQEAVREEIQMNARPKDDDQEVQAKMKTLDDRNAVDCEKGKTKRPQDEASFTGQEDKNDVAENGLEKERINDLVHQQIATDADDAEVAKGDVVVGQDPNPVLSEKEVEMAVDITRNQAQGKRDVVNHAEEYHQVVIEEIQNEENLVQSKEEALEILLDAAKLEGSKAVDHNEAETIKQPHDEPMEVETKNDVVNKEGLNEEEVEDLLQPEIATGANLAEVGDSSFEIHRDPKQVQSEETSEKALEIAQKKEPENMDVSNLVEQYQEVLQKEIRTDIQENLIHLKGGSEIKKEVGKLEDGKGVNLIEVEKETAKVLKGEPLAGMDQENRNADKETATATKSAITNNEFLVRTDIAAETTVAEPYNKFPAETDPVAETIIKELPKKMLMDFDCIPIDAAVDSSVDVATFSSTNKESELATIPAAPKLIILIALSSFGNPTQRANQDRTMAFVQSKFGSSPDCFEVVDGSDPIMKDVRNELFSVSGIRGKYPQFFVRKEGTTTYLGDYEWIEFANETGSFTPTALLGIETVEVKRDNGSASIDFSSSKNAPTATEKAPASSSKILVLVSRSCANLQQRTNQERSLSMIRGKLLPETEYEEIDGSHPSNKDRRNALFAVSGIRAQYPQFFRQQNDTAITFLGDYDWIEYMNETGELSRALLLGSDLPAPEPIVGNNKGKNLSTEPEKIEAPKSLVQKARGPKLVVLVAKSSSNLTQRTNQDRAIAMLKGKFQMEDIETVDGSDPTNNDMRNKLFDTSGIRGNYPQFFLQEKDGESVSFLGDFEWIEKAYETGVLTKTSIFDGFVVNPPDDSGAPLLTTSAVEEIAATPTNKTSEAKTIMQPAPVTPSAALATEHRTSVPFQDRSISVETAEASSRERKFAFKSKTTPPTNSLPRSKTPSSPSFASRATIQQKSAATQSPSLPEPPAVTEINGKRLILLVSSFGGGVKQKTRQLRAKSILQSDKHGRSIVAEEIDCAIPFHKDLVAKLLQLSGVNDIKFPQVFMKEAANDVYTYVGGIEMLEECHQNGTLKSLFTDGVENGEEENVYPDASTRDETTQDETTRDDTTSQSRGVDLRDEQTKKKSRDVPLPGKKDPSSDSESDNDGPTVPFAVVLLGVAIASGVWYSMSLFHR